jgi:flagellar L-ring protein precursor FlgH
MRGLLIATSALLATACAEGVLPMLQKPEIPPPPVPIVDPYQPAEGSLWRGDESRRFLAFENRAKRVGDIVTVGIEEKAIAESMATTELKRTSSFAADLNSDISLQTLVSRPILGLLNFLGFSKQKQDHEPTGNLNIVDADTQTKYAGDGTIEREAMFSSTIACVVTHVTDAGLLYLEGERHLKINHETEIIRLKGYVRPEDIQLDNTVPSALIANAQIEYGGRGAMTDKQREPLFSRVLGLLLPF